MKDINALQLLAKVMAWDESAVLEHVPKLQLLAGHKYDQYQRFKPGRRFIESLANWLKQFSPNDRILALNFVTEKLIFVSDEELSHLVQTAYPDWIVQERIRLVAEENNIPDHRVREITSNRRFQELGIKSLYLGLSDGARTNELRRASDGEISNEQIWQAYELGEEKASDMVEELGGFLKDAGFSADPPRFNMVWLLDDFSGSGNTYIRWDNESKKFKGKIKKVYERLHKGGLIDTSHYEVYLMLYVATRQAVDHIEYWAEQFTSTNGYKSLQVKVLCPLEPASSLDGTSSIELSNIINKPEYYDEIASDKHIKIGGTDDARWGFAKCGLPVVLAHNTPNNSVYLLWGPESFSFHGLFPRVSRHREF